MTDEQEWFLTTWFDAKLGAGWRCPDDGNKYIRATEQLDALYRETLDLLTAVKLKPSASDQRAQQWLEAHAPELLPELPDETARSPVELLINLLEFYIYGPESGEQTEPWKSELDKMQEEAAEGRLISGEEFQARLMNEILDRQDISVAEQLDALDDLTHRTFRRENGMEHSFRVVKDGLGHMTTTPPSNRFKK